MTAAASGTLPHPVTSDEVERPAVRRVRLEFLDALRGIAALAVAFQHGAERLWPQELRFSGEVIRPGEFGVFLFFITSGFIIPASLEKYNSIGRFWVGRFFRLFPLYWIIIGVIVGASAVGLYTQDAPFNAKLLLINATMVQHFTASPLIIGASWTLAFEMCFYLGCSVLFLAGLHRRSAPVTFVLMAAASLVIIPTGPRAITHGDTGTLVLAGFAILGLSLFAVQRIRDSIRAQLGAVALIAVLVVLVFNGADQWYFTFSMFGTMFMGTVLYRWHTGRVDGRTAIAVVFFSVCAWAVANHRYVAPRIAPDLAGAAYTWRVEAVTYSCAVLVFCAALMLRHRSFPRALTYLGEISYSIYLIHALVIHTNHLTLPNRALTLVLWMVLIIVLSALTYHFIEKPFQNLGRHLTRRLWNRPDSSDGRRAGTELEVAVQLPATSATDDASTAPPPARTGQPLAAS